MWESVLSFIIPAAAGFPMKSRSGLRQAVSRETCEGKHQARKNHAKCFQTSLHNRALWNGENDEMMKRRIKIGVDVIMLALFLYLMRYHPGMGLRLHAIFGIALCVLFVLHHVLNGKWYAVLCKGKYRFYRIMLTTSDFLLFAAMLAIMASSFMISGLAFPISFLPIAFYWRNVHIMSTAWGFVLMAFHLGLHLHGFLLKVEKKMSDTIFAYVIYLLELLILGGGIYGFLRSGLGGNLVMRSLRRPSLSDLLFYAEYLTIIGGMCVAVHGLLMAVKKAEEKSL